MTTSLLKDSALQSSTAIAAELMDEIQALVSSTWKIDTDLGGGTLSGSPNNLDYEYTKEYTDNGTIIPGVPAYTITPEYVVPAVVIPAESGCCTANFCGPWSKCTSEIPGTPAITTTPAITVPAVISPAIPALTGGYSTELDISASVVGISDALEPLFSSVTFKSGEMDDPDSDGLASETITYNLDQSFAGTAIQISGRAAFDDLTVDIGGADTNFGNVSTGTMKATPPNVPIEFDAVIVIPSYNYATDIINNVGGVSYSLFPQTNEVSADNLEISTGVTAVADFIDDSLLSYLTDFWNATVAPLFTAVGADAPTAPSQTLANKIDDSAVGLQQTINQSAEQGLNSLLKSELGTIQPYVQALTAATWDYSTYPIIPRGDYADAIMSNGKFSGLDVSNASFKNSNLSGADFSNANVTGSNFTGANLSGTNFTGATGAPSSSASARAKTTTFKKAVAFGANFEGTNFNLSKVFVDNETKLENKQADQAKLFNTATFVASNKKLSKEYGLEYESAKSHFIIDSTCKGKFNKQGLRTDVLKGDLNLNGFKHRKYLDQLPNIVKNRITNYTDKKVNTRSRAELAAIHKIASEHKWDDHDRAEYLASNPQLIKKLGGSEKALDKAKKHFLRVGLFKNFSHKLDEVDINEYIQNYPQVVGETGGIIDPASLAYHYVTVGYDQGQSI